MKDILLVSATTFGIQAFVTLFVIMDPPGATPIFLALVKDQPARKRILMAWQGAASFSCERRQSNENGRLF